MRSAARAQPVRGVVPTAIRRRDVALEPPLARSRLRLDLAALLTEEGQTAFLQVALGFEPSHYRIVEESRLTDGPDICVNICTVAEIYPRVGFLAGRRSWIGRHIDPHAIDECFASTAQKRSAEIVIRRSRHREKNRSFLRPQRLIE